MYNDDEKKDEPEEKGKEDNDDENLSEMILLDIIFRSMG